MIRTVHFVYYCLCWYVCICKHTTYLCLSSLLQNESTFFILISFFWLPDELNERSAFIFFPEIIVSLKKKNQVQEGYKRKRMVSIPYLWCSKTGSSLSREWVAGSVVRHKCYTPSLSCFNAHYNDYVTSSFFIRSAVNDINLIWSSSWPIHPYLAAQTNY